MEKIHGAMNYVIAIPSYNRVKQLKEKTLKTLMKNKINPKKIFIFVANDEERLKYLNYLDSETFNQIIIGQKGIRNQRIFISKYFDQGKYIVSCDDDIEDFKTLEIINGKKTLKTIFNIEYEIIRNFIVCQTYNKFLWGVVAHGNPYWMNENTSIGLYFCIGVFHGYINRHIDDLYPHELSETKEDYEQCILFSLKDGGVVRRNDLCFHTKYNQEGGLGKDRYERNKVAQQYLVNKYPKLVSSYERKNGTPEIKFKFKSKHKINNV
jgi:hypothetical protein